MDCTCRESQYSCIRHLGLDGYFDEYNYCDAHRLAS